MANVVIDIAAEFTGKKAFKQAETSAQRLEKSVNKLGKRLGGLFAASKLYGFGKASVKAFAADEKAARSLALALKNTGNSFASIGVEKFIADLQRTTGVLDDNLRPAFRTLLTATGDVKKSQEGLQLALDISAGTGKDLSAVSMALAKAYGGQTTALSRLGAGLDKATLKTGNMDVILAQLTDKFKGQALAAAQGYSGQLDRLAVASENAKEIIGKDLLDSMRLIAGKEGIGGAASAMENFATQIGNAIYGIGALTTKIKSLPGADFIGKFLGAAGQVSGLGLLSKFGASQKIKSAGTPMQSPGQRAQAVKEARLLKEKNALTSIDNANTTRKLALTGDQLALEELKKKFDITRIELSAALNNTVDRETQLRLLSLLAIHDNDAALAGKIKAELDAAEAAKKLTAAMDASLVEWGAWMTMIGNAFKNNAIVNPTPSGGGGAFVIPDYVPGQGTTLGQTGIPGMGGMSSRGFGMGGFTLPTSSSSPSPTIVVNVAGSVTTQQDLVSAITQGLYNNQASGIPVNYTTAY